MIPPDPDYVERVRTSFGRQQAMTLLGAQMTEVQPGVTEIVLPFRGELTQQHGYKPGFLPTRPCVLNRL